MVDEELLERYKSHPRVLEVRFILLYNLIEREYGQLQTNKLYYSICSAFNCSSKLITAMINRRFDISRHAKTRYKLWRQEVIFTAACYGESMYKAAKDYLGIKPHALYTHSDKYELGKFCTDEWLTSLDKNIVLCAEENFRLEITRFMEIMDALCKVFEKWRT